jgi:limonene-1,2-epoxide hydrolase
MRLFVLILVVLAAGGCGEQPAKPEAVVRAWSDALRRGDIDAATDLFALPAVVANGTPDLRLKTRDEARAFNASFPCGSRVTEVVEHHGVLVVTFVLTERPGGECGSGAGHSARAALEVRDGRITGWHRLDLQTDGPELTPA